MAAPPVIDGSTASLSGGRERMVVEVRITGGASRALGHCGRIVQTLAGPNAKKARGQSARSSQSV